MAIERAGGGGSSAGHIGRSDRLAPRSSHRWGGRARAAGDADPVLDVIAPGPLPLDVGSTVSAALRDSRRLGFEPCRGGDRGAAARA